jgi:hypothetical protein
MNRDADRGALKSAIDALDQGAKKRKLVDHHAVRGILVPLGSLLLEGEDVTREVERIQRIAVELKEKWRNALEFELKLAVSEHVLSVDLRYLSLPDYDFDYTVQARERLEARLLAAEVLGFPASDDHLARVQQADATLEPFLRSREGGESVN